MIFIRVLAIMAITLVSISCSSTDQVREAVIDNEELIKIIEADQKDREKLLDIIENNRKEDSEPSTEQIDWEQVIGSLNLSDEARRVRVKELLEEGRVRTGQDFVRAALVFQHGHTSDDILLAHILSVAAMSQGNVDARRMSAMTLDRYLHRIGQPQVFGTQFNSSDLNDPTQWTMEPYHPGLVSDALREAHCVESLAIQQEFFSSLKDGEGLKEPPQRPCRDAGQ
jgi:hypothetical protein